MKKLITTILSLALILSLTTLTPALAAAPAKDSLEATRQSIRGESSFTAESGPEIWITPIFDEHIITKTNPEKYPPKFLHFAPPENSVLYSFDYNEAAYLNHDTLMFYSYYAHDRASFELFLEKAAPEHILSDGITGPAIYIQPENRRAHALIDLKEMFGGTAKLEIQLDDYSRDITADQLTELIQAEVERVTQSMQAEELDGYWSDGVFTSVEVSASYDPVRATINTAGLTVTRLDGDKLEMKRAEGRIAQSTKIALDSYSYPHSKDDAADAALKDGTPYKCYTSEYTGYASFVILEEGSYGPLYLTIQIDTTPEAFPEELEKTYALVTVEKDPA